MGNCQLDMWPYGAVLNIVPRIRGAFACDEEHLQGQQEWLKEDRCKKARYEK